MILTADKGVALVVVDKEDYIKKAEDLLNQPAPTTRQTNKLINLLKNIKAKGSISEETYKRMYAMGAGSPKFHGLPKIHKAGTLLIPLVSSRDTVTYGTAYNRLSIVQSFASTHISLY